MRREGIWRTELSTHQERTNSRANKQRLSNSLIINEFYDSVWVLYLDPGALVKKTAKS